MESRVLFALALGFLLLPRFHSATFTFQNNCPYTVWPGTLTEANMPQLSSTGFELLVGASSTLNVVAPWKGRIWGRTGCAIDSVGKFACATADCASGQIACNDARPIPPATLVEANLVGNGGRDFYDISLVDGFNIPVSVAPQGGSGDCRSASCSANVNDVCPSELRVAGSDGSVVACKSACAVFNQPQYCCTGRFSTPETCPPTNYSMVFKNQCPQAYSYAYDDSSSTFTCLGDPNYLITFCP